ncbi:MAG: ribosomal protein large subunit ribosomal protein [Candidatus Nomurabacteria bacterium]|nr:ribosomal protein large subunit ribosomal protein [Candidatus Nomurabacteria bacterium]
MELTKAKLKNTHEALKQFEYKNKLAAPKLVKIVVSSGTGSGMKKDREKNNTVSDRLAKITGQKTSLRVAKQSVASFKIREGDPVGVTVTLRGTRMLNFMDKLIHIALPRTKDFRGLDKKAVDSMGNLTLGIKEHTIFPEAADEDLRDVFGLAITMVSTAKNKEEAIAFFEHLGIPFKK